jgi:hypothetical protein
VQEAGVRLDARELLAFEVEDFDGVVAGAAIQSLATGSKVKWGVRKGEGGGLHSKYWKMFMRTCCSYRLAGGVNRPQRLVHSDIPELDLAVATGG